MFKKSLILGSVTLLLLVLFALAGCANPTDGSTGPQGGSAPLTISQDTSSDDLARYFEGADVVRLVTPTVSINVAGEVPPGKTLEIAGSVVINAELTIDGYVHILSTGALNNDANLIPASSGGRLQIDGDLVLAQTDVDFFAVEGIHSKVGFGPNGAVDLQTATDPGAPGDLSIINTNFENGVPAIKTSRVTLFNGDDFADLTEWKAGRKLIVYGSHTTNDDIYLAGRGTLHIGVANRGPTPGILTLSAAGPFTTHGDLLNSSPGIVVDEGASLILNASVVPDNVPITVYGKLMAADGVTTKVIPPNVDISRGTLTAPDDGVVTFTFGPRQVNIGTISLPGGTGAGPREITIAGPAGGELNLVVGTISSDPSATLNLPVGTTRVLDKIVHRDPNPANPLTIRGQRNTAGSSVLRTASIHGATIKLDGADVVIQDRVNLASTDTTLELALINLGPETERFNQLALISGGTVDVAEQHIPFPDGAVTNSVIWTLGDIIVNGEVTFNRAVKATNIIAGVPGAVVNGTGTIIPEALAVAESITFNNAGLVLSSAVNTITDGKSLTLGPNTVLAIGGGLALTNGTFTAKGKVTLNGSTGTISTNDGTTAAPPAGAVGDGLIIGVGDNTIALTSKTAAAGSSASATFIGTDSGDGRLVVLSNAGILIPAAATGTGAIFAVSGTPVPGAVDLNGTSKITLGGAEAQGSRGGLSLAYGADLVVGAAYTASVALPAGALNTPPLSAALTGGASPVLIRPSSEVDGVITETTTIAP